MTRGREPGPAPHWPPAYAVVSLGDSTWVARRNLTAHLDGRMASDLLAGRLDRPGPPERGRGGVVRIDLGGRPAVAKRALHGGLLRPILRGLFWGPARLEAVLAAAVRLRDQGVRTPEVLAIGWRRVAGPLHAHAVITEEVPGAVTLLAALRGLRSPAARRDLLRAAGALVRAMHAAGFVHADLNLANLLLESPAAALRLHVIDLDRGAFESGRFPSRRRRNLERLARSWDKWLGADLPPVPRDAAAFLSGYCPGDRAMARRLFAALARARRRLGPRRLAWRFLRRGNPSAGGAVQ